MNKTDYNEKMSNLLQKQTCKIISSDPTTYAEKKTSAAPSNTEIQQQITPRD